MAKVTFIDKEVHTSGNLPVVGDSAPDFLLTKTDMSDVTLKDFKGKRVVIPLDIQRRSLIFPTLFLKMRLRSSISVYRISK